MVGLPDAVQGEGPEKFRTGLDLQVDMKPYLSLVTTFTTTRARAHAPAPGAIAVEFHALGLRPYAARVLVALLSAGSANSAQLAELSGVPRTSVYQVMDALADQGLVECVPTHGPAVWTCSGGDAVIDALDAAEEERLRQHHARTERLRQELAEILPGRRLAST